MDTAIEIALWVLSSTVGLISGAAFVGGYYSWEAAFFLLVTRLRGIKGIGGFTIAESIGRYEGYALFLWAITLGGLLVKRLVLPTSDTITVMFWVAALVAGVWMRPKAQRITQSAVTVRRTLTEDNPERSGEYLKEAVALIKILLMLLLPFFLMFYLGYLLLQ